MRSECHVFKIHSGLAHPTLGTKGKELISLESACVPGYYLRQKNYKFVLGQLDGTSSFGENQSCMID